MRRTQRTTRKKVRCHRCECTDEKDQARLKIECWPLLEILTAILLHNVSIKNRIFDVHEDEKSVNKPLQLEFPHMNVWYWAGFNVGNAKHVLEICIVLLFLKGKKWISAQARQGLLEDRPLQDSVEPHFGISARVKFP
jgi:hypothetical protein